MELKPLKPLNHKFLGRFLGVSGAFLVEILPLPTAFQASSFPEFSGRIPLPICALAN